MKDKIAFVIAFLGVIIAITPFTEILKNITIEYGNIRVNIITLVYIPLAILFLAVYFYALDYLKYGFKIFDGIALFRYFQIIGDTFYFLAIISPFVYFIIWIVAKVCFLLPLPNINLAKYSYLIPILISFISALTSLYAAKYLNRERRKTLEESLDESSIKAENEVKNLVEKKLWNLSIVKAFRSLELTINKRLIELGVDPSRITTFRAINFLLQNGIIDRKDSQKIQYIRELRNKAVHSNTKFTKKEAIEVVNITKALIPKLEISIPRYSFFENRVFESLLSKDGFFSKKHFYTQSKFGNRIFDALAKGPNYEYIIEVKMTKNPKIILKTLNQIEEYAKSNVRALIVVPHSNYKIATKRESIRILYYDIENDKFTNREEVYDWIHGGKE